jgi:hypothetical protein
MLPEHTNAHRALDLRNPEKIVPAKLGAGSGKEQAPLLERLQARSVEPANLTKPLYQPRESPRWTEKHWE